MDKAKDFKEDRGSCFGKHIKKEVKNVFSKSVLWVEEFRSLS